MPRPGPAPRSPRCWPTCPSCGLVVLNARHTARSGSSEGDPYGGVAAALVRSGMPAVVAMQRPISDGAAIAFSAAFYRQLAAGAGLETALTEGRQAIHTLSPAGDEWAIPVLFGRATSLGIGEEDDDGLPAIFHWVFAALLLVLLALMFAPPPARTAVELKLSTPYVRFRLPAEEQQVFGRLILDELGASDPRAVELGGSRELPAAARFDLLLSGREKASSSITLQQGRVPGQSWIALRRQEDGRYGLAIEAEREFTGGLVFEAVVAGPYRALVRPKGAAPLRFEGAAAVLEVLRFSPRGRGLRTGTSPSAASTATSSTRRSRWRASNFRGRRIGAADRGQGGHPARSEVRPERRGRGGRSGHHPAAGRLAADPGRAARGGAADQARGAGDRGGFRRLGGGDQPRRARQPRRPDAVAGAAVRDLESIFDRARLPDRPRRAGGIRAAVVQEAALAKLGGIAEKNS